MLIPSPPAPGPLVSVGREHFTVYPGVPAYPSHEYAVVCEHHSGELCLCDLKKTPLNTQRQSLKSQVSLTAHTGQVVSKICCNTIQTGPRAVRAHTPQRIYSLASTTCHESSRIDLSRLLETAATPPVGPRAGLERGATGPDTGYYQCHGRRRRVRERGSPREASPGHLRSTEGPT